jgi:hypothetical protein
MKVMEALLMASIGLVAVGIYLSITLTPEKGYSAHDIEELNSLLRQYVLEQDV